MPLFRAAGVTAAQPQPPRHIRAVSAPGIFMPNGAVVYKKEGSEARTFLNVLQYFPNGRLLIISNLIKCSNNEVASKQPVTQGS